MNSMPLQLVEDSARFSCSGCTNCCDQPWRTMIEADKAHALDRHDFSAYPQLAGRTFYHEPADGRVGYYDLAKGEGTRCLFLGADGRCIIHKELGAEAKPAMCRQFPFLPSRTWTDDRVSLNYGCPSVQGQRGELLSSQEREISAVVPRSERAHKGPGVRVPIDMTHDMPHDRYEEMLDRALELFSDARGGDIWTRFAELIALVVVVRDTEEVPRIDGAGSGMARLSRFTNPAQAPMAVRMLFAATLYPDTVPADQTAPVGVFKRLARLPRLLALARLSGAYPSRVLGRNISIDRVLAHDVAGGLDPSATRLLLRYFRSRLWQRLLVGTRLPVVAGVHQHIHDLNAVLFLATAEAERLGATTLSEESIRKALTCVEFHLANQVRLYEQTLKGWMKTNLCSAAMALQAVRLFAEREPASTSPQTVV